MNAVQPFFLYLWSHRALYIGASPDNDCHRHHAAQLCVSLGTPLRFRADAKASWLTGQGFLIPPDQPHQFETGPARILAVYLEPECKDYPFARDTQAVQPISFSDEDLSALRSLADSPVGADEAWSLCAAIFDVESNSRIQSLDSDPRVLSVIDLIRSQPSHAFSAQELADTVHLSSSRLSHLFKSRVGVPIRRFIVWSRLRAMIKCALQGASLTEAAHAAGFSDAAHMSNAFRQMFGFAPSALFSAGSPKSVVIVDDRR